MDSKNLAIAPLFRQQLQAAEQRGIQEGIQEGRQEGQRSLLENFFLVRYGELNAKLSAFLAPVSVLPSREFTLLVIQLSALTVDEQGIEQARRLLAENVLKIRFGQSGDRSDAMLDERIPNLVTNLLALSPEELALLMPQLPQLSDEELFARLSNGNGSGI